jgi:hypothetical protein
LPQLRQVLRMQGKQVFYIRFETRRYFFWQRLA